MGAFLANVSSGISWGSPGSVPATAMTTARWVRITGSPGDNDMNSGLASGYNFFDFFSDGTAVWYERIASGGNTFQAGFCTFSGGGWHHLLTTDTGLLSAGGILNYCDNTLVGTAASGDGLGTNQAITVYKIGNQEETLSRNNMWYAETAVWDRVLTSGEIASLAGGANPSSVSSGLQFYRDLRTSATVGVGTTGAPTVNATFDGADHPNVAPFSSTSVQVPQLWFAHPF